MEVKSPMVELKDVGYKTESCTDGSNFKKKCGNVFFDSVNVQFHIRTFLYQFSAHLFLPLFPFMANLQGQVGPSMIDVLGAWIAPLNLYLMIISYCYIEDKSGVYGAYVIPLVYFLQHRCVISIKYASLSKSEYRRFMECTDEALCMNYLHQIQLFLGWFDLQSDVMSFELSAASARIGARINEIELKIEDPKSSDSAANQLRAWNAFLRGHDVVDYASAPCQQLRPMKDGSYALTVYHLCQALLMHAAKGRSAGDRLCQQITNFFVTLNVAIPLILMMVYFRGGDSASQWAWMGMFVTTSTTLNIFYAQVFYVLLYIAVVDVYRRRSVMVSLNSMIRETDLELDVDVSATGINNCAEDEARLQGHVEEIMSISYDLSDTTNHGSHNVLPHSDDSMLCSATLKKMTAARAQVPDRVDRADSVNSLASSTSASAKVNKVLGERIYKDNERPLLPRICFDNSHNIVAWVHARLVMQNFGERFRFRLEMYVIASIAMMAVMMAVGLLALGMSSQRLEMLCTPWFLQTLLSVTMCIGFNLLIMHCGASVNEALSAHNHTLCTHSLRLLRKVETLNNALLSDTAPEEERAFIEQRVESLLAVAEKLDSMRSVIETNAELKPFKVFGFVADSSLTVSIFTTAVSFYMILFSLVFTTQGDELASAGF